MLILRKRWKKFSPTEILKFVQPINFFLTRKLKGKKKKKKSTSNQNVDDDIGSRRRSKTIGGGDRFKPSHRRSRTVGHDDREAVLGMIQRSKQKSPLQVDHDTTARPVVDNIDELNNYNGNRIPTPQKKKGGLSPLKTRPKLSHHFTQSEKRAPSTSMDRETSTIFLETMMSQRALKKELRRVFDLMDINATYVAQSYECIIDIDGKLVMFRIEIDCLDEKNCVHITRVEGNRHLYKNLLKVFTTYLKL